MAAEGTGGRSALILPIVLPEALAALRAGADPLARRGVPPHVTVLFPFMPAATLTATLRIALRGLFSDRPSFTARFERLERRDAMVWLLPSDPAPFLGLTAAVAARWPDRPPYGGVHEHLIAHLTLLATDDGPALDRAAAAAGAAAPFEVRVEAVQLIVEDAASTWHRRWQLRLGG